MTVREDIAIGSNHVEYLEILFRQGLVQTTKALATYRSIL